MREVATVLGAMVGVIVAFTLLTGGKVDLFTSPAGPGANFAYRGPGYLA